MELVLVCNHVINTCQYHTSITPILFYHDAQANSGNFLCNTKLQEDHFDINQSESTAFSKRIMFKQLVYVNYVTGELILFLLYFLHCQ